MKNHCWSLLCFIFLCFFFPFSLAAQRSFKVCEVKPADTPLDELPYRDVAIHTVEYVNYMIEENRIYGHYLEGQKEADKAKKSKKQKKAAQVIPPKPEPEPEFTLEDCADRDFQLVSSRGAHPFAAAVAYAYGQHRPLVISPDMIWLMVMQGFALHVDLNAEALRHKFVDFDGKKRLVVRRDNFHKESPDNDWEGVFPEFCAQIERYTGPELGKVAATTYSTTGNVERAAFEIVFMDAMSSFFDFQMELSCGIPQVTLEGTPEDWAKLETDVNMLRKYELDWWIDSLQPVLHQLTLSAQGQVNQTFWASIYTERLSSGGCVVDKYVSGWLLKFFPYIQKKQNPVLAKDYVASNQSNIEIDDLPQGMSKVEFVLKDHDGALYNMNFMAGFMGIR